MIIHSDRGSQYCSHAYQQLIQQHQLHGSMSAKGNCYDNACAESFFHSLKVECRQHGIEPQTYDNVEELQAEIDMLAKDLA